VPPTPNVIFSNKTSGCVYFEYAVNPSGLVTDYDDVVPGLQLPIPVTAMSLLPPSAAERM
jgi:hypothetical protein